MLRPGFDDDTDVPCDPKSKRRLMDMFFAINVFDRLVQNLQIKNFTRLCYNETLTSKKQIFQVLPVIPPSSGFREQTLNS